MSIVKGNITITKNKDLKMIITTHAAERFLQRVMSKATYTCFDIKFAIDYLQKVLKDVVPSSNAMQFVLPGFEHFRAVYKGGYVVTIIPKS